MDEQQKLLDELTALNQEIEAACEKTTVELLKEELAPLCKELIELEAEKEKIKLQSVANNKKIMALENKIRSIWEPHIRGSEKSSIDFGDFKLSTAKELSVTVDSADEDGREKAIQWLCDNGYKDCMKLDINTNTMKAILGTEFKEKDVRAPGMKYTWNHPVKVK